MLLQTLPCRCVLDLNAPLLTILISVGFHWTVYKILSRYQQKTAKQINEALAELGRLLTIGLSDIEIMNKMNLRRSTYYYYRARLFEMHGESFKRLKPEDLAFHIDTYRERMTKTASKLDAALNIALRSTDPMIFREAASIATILQNISINLLKLESESIAVARSGLPTEYRGHPQLERAVNDGEPEAIHVLQNPESGEYTFSQRKF